MKKTAHILIIGIAVTISAMSVSCSRNIKGEDEGFYTNPIITESQSTAFHFHNGIYYHLRNANGHIMISSMKDPSEFSRDMEKSACDMKGRYGLEHMWHPQMLRIDGKWYIYATADDGDTDNHKMYVLENPEEDPGK